VHAVRSVAGIRVSLQPAAHAEIQSSANICPRRSQRIEPQQCLPPAVGELVSVAFGLERKEQARKAARARWGRKEIA